MANQIDFRVNLLIRSTLATIAILVTTGVANAAPQAELWEDWQANDPSSTERVDHRDWSDFLERYVATSSDGAVGVAYDEVTADDRQLLDGYLAQLQSTPVLKLTKQEQLSYWINLYNAATVKVVLDEWPVESIRDIKDGLFSSGPWGAKRLKIESKEVSLNDIEHRILRPIWRDPRIHYALNCASIGCPDLISTAFTSENTEQLLNSAATTFVNDPRAINAGSGKIIVSSIYHWFRQDFGNTDAEVLDHIRKFANTEVVKSLEGINKIDDHFYDWSINHSKR